MTLFLWFIIAWNASNVFVHVMDKDSDGWTRMMSVIIHGGAVGVAGYFLRQGVCS